MYKFLFLTLFIFWQVLAQNIKPKSFVLDTVDQLMAEDTTNPIMIENLTDKSITNLISEVKPLDRERQQSNINLNWQSLLMDLNGEPIAQDMAIRRIYKNVEAPQPEFKNITEQSTHKDVLSVLNVTEPLQTQEVASQPRVNNARGTPLGPNITQQLPEDPNKTGQSLAQSISMQQNTKQEHYQNVTNSAKSFVPTPDNNYHSPYLDPYKDANYKSSMPPIQTQEQWNATNWEDEEEKLSDEEVRQAEENREQEKRYKKMQEEINNTTTSCEEFLNNTVFDVEKVLDKDWHTIFYWNVRDEDPYNMKFSRPTETVCIQLLRGIFMIYHELSDILRLYVCFLHTLFAVRFVFFQMIKRFKDELNAEIRPPVDWSAAELFVETNVEYSALYVKTNVSGLYRAIPSASFQCE